MMALSAGANEESFSLCFFISGQTGANTRAINGDWFFGEDVFACLHSGLKVPRPKSWRGCQDHVIDIAGNDLLISIKANKASIGRNINPVPTILEEGLSA